ncbi:T9SS type A sorting domain-containing protein [Reichenbachiella sp.]|uniref:T9SS type A sorting domain-containing protein n=1 Tax=Reichenbachiella sp. TaxID=2184521 RepID=UPI003B58D1E4
MRGFTQCPTSGTISSDCTTSGNLNITGNTLTVDPGVTMTVTGTLTIRGGSTLIATGADVVAGNFNEGYGGLNTLTGGTYSISGTFDSGGGGDFTMNGVNATVTGAANFNGSDIVISGSTFSSASFNTNLATMTMSSSSFTTTGTGDFEFEDATVTNSDFSIGGELYVADGTTSIDNSDIDVGVGFADGVSQTAMSMNGSAVMNFTNNSTIDIKGHVDAGSGADVSLNNSHMYVTGNFDNTGNGTVDISNGGTLVVDGDYDNTGGGNTTVDGGGMVVGGDYEGEDPVVTGGGDEDCSGGSGGCCGSACSGMPVTLVSFKIIAELDQIQLSWQTSSELNNDYFNILRSSDGIGFEIVDRVAGNGTTNEAISYQWTDYPPQKGIYYYQLQQVDYDGSNEFFSIKMVNFHLSQANKIVVYPMPLATGEDFFISFQDEKIESISIYDLSGGSSFNLDYNEELNKIRVNSSEMGLKPGIYVVKITTSLGQYSQKLRVN